MLSPHFADLHVMSFRIKCLCAVSYQVIRAENDAKACIRPLLSPEFWAAFSWAPLAPSPASPRGDRERGPYSTPAPNYTWMLLNAVVCSRIRETSRPCLRLLRNPSLCSRIREGERTLKCLT